MEDKLDIVIWGATGFTGRLATAYLAGAAGEFHSFTLAAPAAPRTLRWAIAGRNRAKLEGLVASFGLPESVEIIVAEASDAVAIDAFVRRTRVVCALAGPFVKYTDRVLAACAKHGTHFVDCTGETAWVRSAIDRFDDRAQATGACIVNFCGYDSIPSDLGAFVAINALRAKLRPGAAVKSVTTYQAMFGGGGFSGGSVATGMSSHLVRLTQGVDPAHPFLLGGERAAGVRDEDASPSTAVHCADIGAWTAPFGMESINSRVVRRSCALLSYGSEFTYREVAVAPSEKHARKAAARHANPVPPAKLLQMIEAGRLPSPGEGPPAAVRAACRFATIAIAKSATGEQASVVVSGGEAGYEETAKMAVESALALALTPEGCPGVRGGFATPAAALGSTLVDRLRAAGIAFDVVDDPKRALRTHAARAAAAKASRL